MRPRLAPRHGTRRRAPRSRGAARGSLARVRARRAAGGRRDAGTRAARERRHRPRGAHVAARACSSRTTGSIRSETRSCGTGPERRSRSRGARRESSSSSSTVVAPRPPGSYRLAFDLVEEFRFWFQELGSTPLDLPVDVKPRIDERRLRVRVHGASDPALEAALAAQDEPIVARGRGRGRAPRSGRRPGLGLVATASSTRTPRATRPSGRRSTPKSRADRRRLRARGRREVGATRASASPLLLPSLLDGLEPREHEGLPAYAGPDGLFEGRAVVRLRSRSGRPSG